MNHFLADLWHDLREKRLWPVAAVLLAALVAVPLALRKGEAEAPPPPPVAGAPADAQGVAAVVPAEDGGGESNLELFREKDPFAPRGPAAPKPPSKAPDPAGGTGASSGGSSSGNSSSGGSSSGGSSTSGGQYTSKQAVPGYDGGSPQYGGAREPTLYTYVVDVRFGRRGRERTRRDLGRLDPLPNADAPMLIYMGTSKTGHSAVFLLSDTIAEQHGEGVCEPSRSECSLLYLREDAEHDLHFFTDDRGRGWAIRLLDIDLVPVEEVEEQEAEEARRSRKAHGTSAERRWPFERALFADVAR